jgi:hypothetical protein
MRARHGVRIYRLEPRPCRHELAGQRPHASAREWLACLEEFGVPGFRVTEERW